MNCLGELDIICSIRLNLVDTIASRHISCLTLDMDMSLALIDKRGAVAGPDNIQRLDHSEVWGDIAMLSLLLSLSGRGVLDAGSYSW